MRIVQACPWFRPHVGGVETHVAEISQELARRGHDVTVLTSRYERALPEREEFDGVHVLRVKTRGVWIRTPIAPATKAAIPGLRPDVVHGHSPPPLTAYYAGKACLRATIPYVVTYHCDIEAPSVFGPLIESVWRHSLGPPTMARADRIIVTTSTYAATSRSVWRMNPVVIPNAVDAKRFHPGVDGSPVLATHGVEAGEPVVLTVGRMYPHKGIENVVEAARKVAYARFLVVGGGPELRSLKAFARRVGVHDRVVFTGQVSEDLLPAYFAACDVFVLPSESRLEAFGIVALEAMATGKPVVVSDIPGVREVIADGREGLLSDAVNPDDLALKIRTLLADDRKRAEMGRRGREAVERDFSLETVVNRIERVYEAATRTGSATRSD